MTSRAMAVDPGEVRIGLALSDPSQTIAHPLDVLPHRARRQDAEAILEVARRHDVSTILVGVALDQDGQVGPQARRALRLAEALRAQGDISVVTWDESGSTQAARATGRRDRMLDARAAAYILQEYLDAQAKAR